MSQRIFTILKRSLHSTPKYLRSQAGKHRPSKFQNKPLTYDQAFRPDEIAVSKGWVSFHTGNLHGETDCPARVYEDRFIRRFMEGTFHRMLTAPIVVKRRFNIIEVIAFINLPKQSSDKIYFLHSYTERLLSGFFKCIFKVHLYRADPKDVLYKYI